jgi:hypothetical protein
MVHVVIYRLNNLPEASVGIESDEVGLYERPVLMLIGHMSDGMLGAERWRSPTERVIETSPKCVTNFTSPMASMKDPARTI